MNKQQLANRIWASANKMRSKIEANEYKDYILGFIFYKFLSEREIQFVIEKGLRQPEFSEELTEDKYDNVKWLQDSLGYFISYENLYSTWIDNEREFSVANVRDGLSAFARLVSQTHRKVFDGIFDTLQNGLSNLGGTDAERTKAIRDLLYLIKDIPMTERQDYDVLGFIYEYLISQFAANAGKKAGEFYTPHEVSLLMSEIIAYHLRNKENISIYDPTSGSGSLLINIGKAVSSHIAQANSVKYYAQELKKNTFNLTRMNLVMRGIIPDNIIARNGDTLEDDWPYFEDEDKEGTYHCLHVDAVVSNPPYSQSWTPPRKGDKGIQIKIDPRFEYGIAPKGKADYAFLLHDLYHLKSDGVMAIVLPHGVLFRGDAGDGTLENPGDQSEGSIRRQLIENNNIDTIIGLPEDIFFGTGIPTIVMILRKSRKENDVLIIDASKGYKKEGKKNKLRASDIRRIVDTHKMRLDIPKYSRVVSKEEIRRNGYNLNIPRYVNSSEDAEKWDIYATVFGNVPKSELSAFKDYFDAFKGLREELFENTDTPCVKLKVDNLQESIANHPSVKDFVKRCNEALKNVNDYLIEHIMGMEKMMTVNSVREEENITKCLFDSLSEMPLVDRYNAFQLFADKWSVIAQDLEIIQTEGFEATRVVDPNMVLKKKDDKEYEVQDGWVGHVLPFELVMAKHLGYEWKQLRDMETKVEENTLSIDEIYNDLDEETRDKVSQDWKLHEAFVEPVLKEYINNVDIEEIRVLDDYLNIRQKKLKYEYVAANPGFDWKSISSAEYGIYSATTIKERIKKLQADYLYAGNGMERKLLDLNDLICENKKLNKDIKIAKADLHQHIKEVIENDLDDEQVLRLLKIKWIDSLYEHLLQLPKMVVDDFVDRLTALANKYAVTFMDVEKDIREASLSLSSMIDELTGSNADMEALNEFKNILLQ